MISSNVEAALEACGRDRVFHNDGSPPSVAVRWSPMLVPPEERWIVGSGDTHDAAGRIAAKEFAERLRKQAASLTAWADNIEKALGGKEAGGG